jgi:Leucine-rich repeat (LRR) protein
MQRSTTSKAPTKAPPKAAASVPKTSSSVTKKPSSTTSGTRTGLKAAIKKPASRGKGFEIDEDSLFGNSLSLEKIYSQAQQSGSLNLASRKLETIPPEVFKLKELTFEEEGKWWEREDLKRIDLSHNQISSIPPDIAQLGEFLQVFLISNNKLQSVSKEVYQLNVLVKLDLSSNQLEHLESGISSLVSLSELLLSGNALASLPEDIGDCPSLEKLDVSQNKLKTLPEKLGKCRNLRTLMLGNNEIVDFPAVAITALGKLQELELQNNKLVQCPPLSKLHFLVRVNLSQNKLKAPPEFGGDLAELKEIHLGFNNMDVLATSPTFFKLPNLTLLNVQNNNIGILPPELIELRSLNFLVFPFFLFPIPFSLHLFLSFFLSFSFEIVPNNSIYFNFFFEHSCRMFETMR